MIFQEYDLKVGAAGDLRNDPRDPGYPMNPMTLQVVDVSPRVNRGIYCNHSLWLMNNDESLNVGSPIVNLHEPTFCGHVSTHLWYDIWDG